MWWDTHKALAATVMFTASNMDSRIGTELLLSSPKISIITHFKISKAHRGQSIKCLRACVHKASV